MALSGFLPAPGRWLRGLRNHPKRWTQPAPPNVPLLRALWSLLDGIWGVLKGSWGVLEALRLGASLPILPLAKPLQGQL